MRQAEEAGLADEGGALVAGEDAAGDVSMEAETDEDGTATGSASQVCEI